jgi:hypothetical protein
MKTSSRILKLLILLLGLIIQTLQAQDNASLQKIKLFPQHFTAFSNNYPQEKVYLHFDNTAYYLDETIWFKAYVVRADQNSLSQISKILYVELVSAEGYVIDTKKLKIENGQCHGSFNPMASNFAGFYEIRAYTSYMLNFGKKNYFSRVFPIYDKPKKPGEYIPQITDRINTLRIPEIRSEYGQKDQLAMTFYPEGGNSIAGLNSKVAFKTIGKKGENLIVSGSIYNEKDEKLVDFSSEYLGMGSFEYLPTSGKYVAKVQYNNKEYKFELPAALAKGYSMSVDNSLDDKINILISKNNNTTNEPLGLCISCRGVSYNVEQVDLGNKSSLNLLFSKNKIPSGVSQITLYNASGEVMCERMVFVNHHIRMKVDQSQSKSVYQPFEKVDMEFQFKDHQDNPVESTFSVSVRDATTSSSNPFSDNLLTNLLLSSELSGYIENPDYYFQSDDNVRKHELDLLLLTQGWSRYSWKQMIGKTPFALKYPIEKELVIDGSVASLIMKNKLKDVDITMVLSSDSLPQYGRCKTDSAGNFNFVLRDFRGEGKLSMQSRQDGKRKEMYIKLNRNFSPEPKTYAFAELNIPQYFNTLRDSIIVSETKIVRQNDSADKQLQKEYNKLPMDKKVILLSEVTVKDKRKPIKVSVKYDVAKELDKRNDVGDWIPANVNTFLYFTSNYYNASTGMYKSKYVMFIREDVVAETNPDMTNANDSETDKLPALSNTQSGGEMPYLDEIESISFIEDYSSILRLTNGLIDPSNYVIALIRCKSNYRKEPYGIRNTTFSGFSYVKEFYSPQYDKMILPDEKDYRRTLYWNPDIQTDKEGKATISFYNNSSCKAMNVDAEMVTSTGIIGVFNK